MNIIFALLALLGAWNMGIGKLSIGTDTDRVYLIGASGWFVGDWTPQAGDHLGTFAESALADYRAMMSYRDLTTIDSFTLKATRGSQDELIRVTQDLRRMLRKAIDYWTTNWQKEPVYIEAQADCETNTRYTIIHDARLPEDRNPYAAPFMGKKSTMDGLALTIEHGSWLENPPGDRTCVQTSGLQTWLYNQTTTTDTPGQSSDDIMNHTGETSLNMAATALALGYDTELPCNTAIRFQTVNVPFGSVIIAAWVTFESTADNASTVVRVKIQGEDIDDAAAFSDYANYVSRTRTSALVQWHNIEAWTSGDTFNSPDITPIIQEIIDRSGWTANNDIVLFFDDDGSDSTGAYRLPASWDNLALTEPILTIIYALGGDYGRSPTCNNEVYISNKQNMAQLTHTYWWSGGPTWSGNLIGAVTPFELFDNPPADGDILYFGIDSTIANSGPFCSLVFDIGTAATYVGAAHVHWWYSTGGGGWNPLTVQDNTGYPQSFSIAGVNSVHWQQPSNWATDTVNGVTGYWVRVALSIGVGESITTPTQRNRDIYTVTRGSALIDDAQIPGDISALLEFTLHNQSGYWGTSVTEDLTADRVICGLRATDRGDEFSAYINMSDEQNPIGLNVFVSGAYTALVNDMETPTGRRITYTPGGIRAFSTAVYVNIGHIIAGDYVGTFHAYLRVQQVNDHAGDIGARLLVYSFSYPMRVYSETAYTQGTGITELLDLGRVILPVAPVRGDEVLYGPDVWIELCCLNNAHSPVLRLYDLILVPVDEWAIEVVQTIEEGISRSFIRPLDTHNYLDLDGIRNPKAIESFIRNEANDRMEIPYTVHTNAWPRLTDNKEQRLWVVTSIPNISSGLVSKRQSEPEVCHTIQVWRNARYLSMRGNR